MKKGTQVSELALPVGVSSIGKELYYLQKNDFKKASCILFEAFREDPFFVYAFGERHDDEALVRKMHIFSLGMGLRYGLVQAPSAAMEGVAIWLSPGNTAITPLRALQGGILSFAMQLLQERGLAGGFLKKMAAFSNYSDQLHKRHAHFPHWYLLAIGIGGKSRGKGYASKLLRPMLAWCDDHRIPIYLETHNEANLELYHHFGFVMKEEGMIPGSDTKQWAMLRMPPE